jgi:hypothetical protein
MKKAKILLSVTLLIAIVGSIFAMKMSKRGSVVYTGTGHGARCTVTVANRTLTTTGSWTYATAIFNSTCVWTFTTALN